MLIFSQKGFLFKTICLITFWPINKEEYGNFQICMQRKNTFAPEGLYILLSVVVSGEHFSPNFILKLH